MPTQNIPMCTIIAGPDGIAALLGDTVTPDGPLIVHHPSSVFVTFTPNIPHTLLAIDGGGTYSVQPVRIPLDAYGKLNGSDGVTLLADDPSLHLSNPLQYTLTVTPFRVDGYMVTLAPFQFIAPGVGEIVTLEDLVPAQQNTAPSIQYIADNSITKAKMADDSVGIAELSATGTPSATTYLRGDNAWATPSGGGDTSTNTSVSVNSELVLFANTTGKLLKRATGSGLAKLTSGVLGTATAGTDYVTPTGSGAGLTSLNATNVTTGAMAQARVTNLTTDLAAKADKSTLTAKGDIYVATASGVPSKLAVGSDGQVLTADSVSAGGVKWGTVTTLNLIDGGTP